MDTYDACVDDLSSEEYEDIYETVKKKVNAKLVKECIGDFEHLKKLSEDSIMVIGSPTGRIKKDLIRAMYVNEVSPLCIHDTHVMDIDYADIELRTLAHIINLQEETMGSCNVANKVARLIHNNVLMAAMSIQPQVFEDKMGVLHVFYRGNQHPIPKTMNARQAWKKRGKTSKRKGTRK